jgi:hypothetical protein
VGQIDDRIDASRSAPIDTDVVARRDDRYPC